MSLRWWFTRNWADTDEGGDPALVPWTLAVPPDQALDQILAVIGRLPRWEVREVNRPARTIHATRRSRLFRFVDDVHLRLEETAAGTRVHGRSQARIGKADLGQNRRNLRRLFRALS